MTMVPRTGPLSASSALLIRSWYQRGKSSAWGVRTGAFAMERWYGARPPQRESVISARRAAKQTENAFRSLWTRPGNSSCLALGDESGTRSRRGGTRRIAADWGFEGTYPLSRIQARPYAHRPGT